MRPGVLEERQVETRAALVVAIEKVIDGRIVLVDGLLDRSEAQDPGVKVDVRLGIAGDRADVVDAFEFHLSLYTPIGAVTIPVSRSASRAPPTACAVRPATRPWPGRPANPSAGPTVRAQSREFLPPRGAPRLGASRCSTLCRGHAPPA